MKLLETKSLTIGYRQTKGEDRILQRDINVQIRPGEIVSLMGQNGVGKTTFIKSISGLLSPISGEVFYQGKNLQSISNRELAKKLSLVLTEKPFSFNISVLELIAIGRHPYSNWMGILSQKDKDVIEWAFEETHTNYLANNKLYELSDGQLQKVMIARALAQETDLIMLDEPTAHLDLYNKIEVMMLLRHIARTGKGVLISTHDMQICTQLSDRLWLFNFMQGVQEGLPEDLILDGTLEKTLYLEDYGYDMIHGSIKLSPEGSKVKVSGPDKIRFWTEQALKRNGYEVNDEADFTIIAANNTWQINDSTGKTTVNSIEELLKKIGHLDDIRHP